MKYNNIKYSFITPRQKYLISQDSRVWFGFIATIVVLVLSFYSFLLFKTSQVESSVVENNQRVKELKFEVTRVEKEINWINEQKRFAEEIYSNNAVIKNSIKNLFDLIPAQITLTNVVMHKEELVVQGITPSKDIYKFLLAVPLKSIFTSSSVEFYRMKNGNYTFRSVNTFEKVINTKELLGDTINSDNKSDKEKQ
jgi:Na+/melibiose symporter-like transporter